MYIWFTNLPTVEDEENLEPHEKSPGGITGKATNPVICTGFNVALVRGPSRLDQNTAGVRTFQNAYSSNSTYSSYCVIFQLEYRSFNCFLRFRLLHMSWVTHLGCFTII